MTISKAIITAFSILSISQMAFAGPNEVKSNATPDILVGGLKVETGTHSGSILNGSSTVYAKNARSFNNGLCTFKINFSIYNDSPVKPGTFITTMGYNNNPSVINDYTTLPSTNIKTYEWLVHLKPGKNTIKVHADQQNTIHESNELNNRLTKHVNVIGQCSAQNIKLTPKQPVKALPAATQQMKTKALPAPKQAQKGCEYDPDSARLPCIDKKRKKMKTINPFK